MTPAAQPPLLAHTVPAGAAWSLQVARGRTLTFTAEADRANVSVLLFAATDRADRLNIPDTLKAQYSARISADGADVRPRHRAGLGHRLVAGVARRALRPLAWTSSTVPTVLVRD